MGIFGLDMPTVGSVLVALITMVGSVVAAYLSFKANREASQANDAVNHRHPDHPRLYDAMLNTERMATNTERDVRDLLKWREVHESRWNDLDPEINNAHRLSDKLYSIDQALKQNEETHQRIIKMITTKGPNSDGSV